MGSRGVGSSRGALAVSVFELHKDEKIYILVGQKGENACIKSFMHRDEDCESSNNESTNGGRSTIADSKTKQIKDIVIEDGAGGGGGGATFIYLLNSAELAVPLLVAAGGGGLGYGNFFFYYLQFNSKNVCHSFSFCFFLLLFISSFTYFNEKLRDWPLLTKWPFNLK